MYKKKYRVAMITSLLPETNYSRYLCHYLNKHLENNLLVYVDIDNENKKIKDCGQIKLVWRHSISYIYKIIKQVSKDKIKLVHLQHEINMYGGVITALVFPLLVFSFKLIGVKTVVTIHAVVPKKIINKCFIRNFREESKITPLMLKIFFIYINKTICFLSNKVIVHTHMLKNNLVSDYGVAKDKVAVVSHGVPIIDVVDNRKQHTKKYFLYFGYITKRKGLEDLVKGYAKFIKQNNGADYKLVLAGGVIKGQEFAKEEIMKLIKDLKIRKNIEVTGFIEKNKIEQLFINAYAVTIPAIVSISASGPLAQSFAYGKCVIASGVDNFKEEIKDDFEGILVDKDDWCKALIRVYENPSLVKKIEFNVISKAKKRSWDIIAKKHLEIYKNL